MDSYEHPVLLVIVDGSQTGVYLQALDAKEMMAAIQRWCVKEQKAKC